MNNMQVTSTSSMVTMTMMKTSIGNLINLFECTGCDGHVLPPILQCQEGHLICSTCRFHLTYCPTCLGPLGNIRNISLDRLADTIFFPCKNYKNGCTAGLLHTAKLQHEEDCEYTKYYCPCYCFGDACLWQGTMNQIVPHLQMYHSNLIAIEGNFASLLVNEISFDLPDCTSWIMKMTCFGKTFMLVLFKYNFQIYGVVQLIGSRRDAAKFYYKLMLYGPRHRQTWEAATISIPDGVAHAYRTCNCLSFDTTLANHFSSNGDLIMHVIISMAPSYNQEDDEDDDEEADEVEADEVEADEVEADEVEADEVEADEVEADEEEADEEEEDDDN